MGMLHCCPPHPNALRQTAIGSLARRARRDLGAAGGAQRRRVVGRARAALGAPARAYRPRTRYRRLCSNPCRALPLPPPAGRGREALPPAVGARRAQRALRRRRAALRDGCAARSGGPKRCNARVGGRGVVGAHCSPPPARVRVLPLAAGCATLCTARRRTRTPTGKPRARRASPPSV